MSRRQNETEFEVLEKGMFVEDLEQLAAACLKVYFADKRKHDLTEITKEELLSDFCLKTVLRTQFDDRCFDYIHSQCLVKVIKPENEAYDDPTLDWTVHVLLGLLQELMALELPKAFQPGLLLLYFKFCHGIEIPQPPIL